MVKEIPLTRGMVAIVDDEDYDLVSKHTWHCTEHGYAARRNPSTKKIEYLHRFIMRPPESKVIDHINHNKLDNRRSNLRICTVSENLKNTRPKRGTSKYKGVHFKKGRSKPWRARIHYDGVDEILGDFYTEEEAAYAYNLRAIEVHGEFAFLNDVHIKDFKQFAPRETSSKHRGVYWCKNKKRWRAKIRIDGKQMHIGYYREENDAANAYKTVKYELERGML